MNASLTANRVWPLALLLAAIVLLMHATQSASGAEPGNCSPSAKPIRKSLCLPTWCQGCPKAKLTCCDDYCRKPAPCVRKSDWCGLVPDYCRKCLPTPPCCAVLGCDDYCRKPCPMCPVMSCPAPCKVR